MAHPPRAVDLAAFNERAAIMEYDGGLPRWEADQAAAREMSFDTAEALLPRSDQGVALGDRGHAVHRYPQL